MTGALERLGEVLVSWALWMNVMAGAVLVVVLATDYMLRRRVSAKWRLLLPAAVLLRLVIPVSWTSPIGLWARADAARAPEVTTVVSEAATNGAAPDVVPATSPRATSRLTWRSAAAVAYAGAALGLLVAWLGARRSAAKCVRQAGRARPELAALAPGFRVLEHDSLGPAVVGLLRPAIVVPRSLVPRLQASELAAVMRHEMAHMKRGDHVVAVIIALVTVAAWPVVAAWVAARRARVLMEQACDEAAIAASGWEADPIAYGRALLSVASLNSTPRLRIALGLLPFGSALRARVGALRHRRRWRTPAQAIVVLGLVPLLLMLAANGREVASAASPEEIAADDRRPVATVVELEGDVKVQHPGSAKWEALSVGHALSEGDKVWAQTGQVKLEYGGGEIVDVFERTIIEIESQSNQAIFGRGDLPDSLAAALAELVPPSIVIEETSVTGDQLLLRGRMASPHEFARFLRSLEQSPALSEIAVGRVTKVDAVTSFKLTATLRTQVMIELMLLDAPESFARDHGLDLGGQPDTMGEALMSAPVTISVEAFEFALKVEEPRNGVQVLAAPRVLVDLGERAQVETSTETPDPRFPVAIDATPRIVGGRLTARIDVRFGNGARRSLDALGEELVLHAFSPPVPHAGHVLLVAARLLPR
jgi:beta-lactamase regulating signal transducer with metallopeptidase domain